MHLALATCSAFPECDADEQPFIAALRSHGVDVTVAVWDDPTMRWDSFDLTMVRDTWDYCERRADFLDWARRVPRLHNPAAVLEWNTDKRYMRELVARDIPVVPTQWIESESDAQRMRIQEGDLVVKPVVSAGSRNTERYTEGEHRLLKAHVRSLLSAGHAVMLQPYISSVDTHGETALIFFNGAFSHAVRKEAILVQRNPSRDGLFAAETISPHVPSASERGVAERVMDALPFERDSLLYARVDLVQGDAGESLVLEVELTEPSLFFLHDSHAAERAVNAVIAISRRPAGYAC